MTGQKFSFLEKNQKFRGEKKIFFFVRRPKNLLKQIIIKEKFIKFSSKKYFKTPNPQFFVWFVNILKYV